MGTNRQQPGGLGLGAGPAEKVAPKRGLLLALAVALGLMLGVMAAFLAEALRPQERATG
jgi:uncharacterized protein involved in exopolysaccharide biosynthesis